MQAAERLVKNLRGHMRLLSLRLLVALLLFAVGCSSTGADQAIRAHYAEMDASVEGEKIESYMAPIAPDFVLTQKDGKTLNRATLETAVKDGFKAGDMKSRTTVQDVQVSGDEAKVQTSSEQTGSYTDPRGKTHTVELKSVSLDVWKRSGSDWLLATSTEESHDVRVDGK